jgi:hypothetical protein
LCKNSRFPHLDLVRCDVEELVGQSWRIHQGPIQVSRVCVGEIDRNMDDGDRVVKGAEGEQQFPMRCEVKLTLTYIIVMADMTVSGVTLQCQDQSEDQVYRV